MSPQLESAREPEMRRRVVSVQFHQGSPRRDLVVGVAVNPRMNGARVPSERAVPRAAPGLVDRSERAIGGFSRTRRVPRLVEHLREPDLGGEETGIEAHRPVELVDRFPVAKLAKVPLGLLLQEEGFFGGRARALSRSARRRVVLPIGEQTLPQGRARQLGDRRRASGGRTEFLEGLFLPRPIDVDQRVERVGLFVERARDDPTHVRALGDGGERCGPGTGGQDDLANPIGGHRAGERGVGQIGGQEVAEQLGTQVPLRFTCPVLEGQHRERRARSCRFVRWSRGPEEVAGHDEPGESRSDADPSHAFFLEAGRTVGRERRTGQHGAQVIAHRVRGSVTPITVLLEKPIDDRAHRGRRELRWIGGAGSGLLEDGGRARQERGALEGVDSRDRLVEERPEREQVAPRIERLTAELLRRHVEDRPGDRPRGGLGRHRGDRLRSLEERRRVLLRQPEVHDLDVARRGHHHVRRLEVAVHEARRMDRPERLGDLDRASGHGRDARPILAQHGGERAAFDVLHHDVRAVVLLDDVEDGRDVGRRDARGATRLVHHLASRGGVRFRRLGERLDGDRAAEAEILGAVHHAHAARADLAGHSIAAERDADQRSFRTGNVEHEGGPRNRACVYYLARRLDSPCRARQGVGDTPLFHLNVRWRVGGTLFFRRRAVSGEPCKKKKSARNSTRNA